MQRFIYYPKYDATLIIDSEDLDLVINKKNGSWIGTYNGSSGWQRSGRAALHRTIIERVLNRELDEDEIVDHIDRNNCNNSRSNLRTATISQNNRNKTASGTSKYLGVSWQNKTNKWKVEISTDGKYFYCGLFTDELEAAEAFNRAVKIFRPDCEHSRVNNISLGYSNNNRPIGQIKYDTREITQQEYEEQINEKTNFAPRAPFPNPVESTESYLPW